MTASQNILALIHEVAILFPVFLLLFSFRGFFLAGTSALLGDKTAHEEGRFTLNPFVHLDVINLAVFVGVIYFIGGLVGDVIPRGFLYLLLISLGQRWLFSFPVYEGAFKFPRLYSVLFGFASAVSFMTVGFLGLVVIKVLNLDALPRYAFISLVEYVRSLVDAAIFFGAIHCIPIPPLDASRILYPLISSRYHYIIDKLHEYDLIILLMIYLLPGVSHAFWRTVAFLQFTIKSTFVSILF